MMPFENLSLFEIDENLSFYLTSTYIVPATRVSTLWILSHLLFTTTLDFPILHMGIPRDRENK